MPDSPAALTGNTDAASEIVIKNITVKNWLAGQSISYGPEIIKGSLTLKSGTSGS
jgi:hypothetical protein